MSGQSSGRNPISPGRVFGASQARLTPSTTAEDSSAVDTTDDSSPARRPDPPRDWSSQATSQRRRPSTRISFSSVLKHRPSFVDRWRNAGGDEESGQLHSPKPPIPSALQPPTEVYSTPLPILSMIVLSIVCVLSAEASVADKCVVCRLCLESSCRRMYRRRSCCLWLKVS